MTSSPWIDNLLIDFAYRSFSDMTPFSIYETSSALRMNRNPESTRWNILYKRLRYHWRRVCNFNNYCLQCWFQKLKLYKTLLKPVLTYGSECSSLNRRNKEQLQVFEKRIIREIFGPICDNGKWRIRFNSELTLYIQTQI